MTKPLLVVDGISKSFRGLRAVANVSFTVEEGGIVGLIGPNGAGKTLKQVVLPAFSGPTAARFAWATTR